MDCVHVWFANIRVSLQCSFDDAFDLFLRESKENRHHSEKNPHVSTVNTVPSELQGDLTEYLDRKLVNQLFVKLTESVLLEKPPQPVGFIFDFLLKTYPEEGRVAMDNMNPKLKSYNE